MCNFLKKMPAYQMQFLFLFIGTEPPTQKPRILRPVWPQ